MNNVEKYDTKSANDDSIPSSFYYIIYFFLIFLFFTVSISFIILLCNMFIYLFTG